MKYGEKFIQTVTGNVKPINYEIRRQEFRFKTFVTASYNLY